MRHRYQLILHDEFEDDLVIIEKVDVPSPSHRNMLLRSMLLAGYQQLYGKKKGRGRPRKFEDDVAVSSKGISTPRKPRASKPTGTPARPVVAPVERVKEDYVAPSVGQREEVGEVRKNNSRDRLRAMGFSKKKGGDR